MNPMDGKVVLTLVANRHDEANLLRYANMVTNAVGAQARVMYADEHSTGIAVTSDDAASKAPPDDGCLSLKDFVSATSAEVIVSDWSADPAQLQWSLRLIVDTGSTGIVVRSGDPRQIRRVLVPSSGGPHTLQQLWIARALATALGVPVRLVHLVSPGRGLEDTASSPEWHRFTHAIANTLGMKDILDIVTEADPVTGIARCAQPHDLIVMGAPHRWRVASHFAGSVPDLVAASIPNQLVMLVGKRSPRVRLRDVLWEELIDVRSESQSAEQAIATLVGLLVEHRQLPAAMTEYAYNKAMERERIMPTTAGYETAFPHIALPTFTGLLGAMAICRRGVPFGPPPSPPVRFVFLLVTPVNYYSEYLVALARIAQRMVVPQVRADLLACQSSHEVLNILDPLEA